MPGEYKLYEDVMTPYGPGVIWGWLDGGYLVHLREPSPGQDMNGRQVIISRADIGEGVPYDGRKGKRAVRQDR